MDEKRSAAILLMAKIVLVVLLLYVGIGVVTNRLHLGAVFDPHTASGEQPSAGEQTAPAPERAPSDYGAIVERNLFTEIERAGQARTGPGRSAALDAMPAADDLGLRLVGAIAGSRLASRALIQNTRTNTTGSYQVGETVACPTGSAGAGATVEVIQRDVVVLRYEGKDLVLKLRSGTATGGPAPSAGPADKAQGNEAAPGAGSVTALEPQAAPLPAHAGYVAEVFRKATIEPYVVNGQTEGLKITGLDELPMAQLFGLKNGDIVQNVNGQQLTSKQKAFQVFMKAKTQPKVDIQLLRDGKRQTLSFDL